MKRTAATTGVAIAIALTAGAHGAAAAPTPPAQGFVRTIDNPWFPLIPGSRYRYEGVKDGNPAIDVMKVTHRIKRILGAPMMVVDDRLYEHGKLAEKTLDYYAQDVCGNVWYFGEDTAELDGDGHVISTEGSSGAPVSTAPSPACSCQPTRRSASTSGRSGTPARPRTSSASRRSRRP